MDQISKAISIAPVSGNGNYE